jgi:hypothetical protein
MPLNFGSGGEVKPYIRFKPSINAWEMSSDDGAIEFEMSAPVVIDVERIQLGWLLLGEGLREWQIWPDNKQTAKPDTDQEWKSGFLVSFFSKAMFGQDGQEPVREFNSSQTGSTEFIKKLYNQCEAEFGKGVVPVVKITGAAATKIGKGTTRIPTFELVKFVARPAELGGGEAAPEPAAQPAPKASKAPKAKVEEAEEF